MDEITLLDGLLALRARGCTHVVDDYESDQKVTAIDAAIENARGLRPDQLGGMRAWVVRGDDIYDSIELEHEGEIVAGFAVPALPYRKGVVIGPSVWELLRRQAGSQPRPNGWSTSPRVAGEPTSALSAEVGSLEGFPAVSLKSRRC